MRRTALISDIHGNLPALEAVAADIKTRQVDQVINLGDHLSGPLWPGETLAFLKQQNWIHVLGNHDRQLIRVDPAEHSPSDRHAFPFLGAAGRAWLEAQLGLIRLEQGWTAFHGAPQKDTTYLLETIAHGRMRLATPDEIRQRLGGMESGVLVCGHTHLQRVVQVAPGLIIINPGSVGLPAYDDDVPEYHKVENGSPHARYAVVEEEEGRLKVDFILVAYDHHSAAAQARRNGRPEWEYALLTGTMPER